MAGFAKQWEQLAAYAAEEWVPSRIAVGKHKGRSIAERLHAGSRGFQAPDDTRGEIRRGATFATDALGRDRRKRRSATRVVCRNGPGLESPGYRRGIAPRLGGCGAGAAGGTGSGFHDRKGEGGGDEGPAVCAAARAFPAARPVAALAEKQELSAGEAAEVSQLWRKVVKLVSPRPLRARAWRASRCRCRGSGHRQRGALHCAIAEDPHGFILRQGWAALDFGEEREIAQVRRLWESIELEIIRVLEAGHAPKESWRSTSPPLTGTPPDPRVRTFKAFETADSPSFGVRLCRSGVGRPRTAALHRIGCG